MPRRKTRFAFLGPITWDARKGTRWESRGCSTNTDPGRTDARCGGGGHWFIARSPESPNGRFVCDGCRKSKYGHLEGRLWNVPEIRA